MKIGRLQLGWSDDARVAEQAVEGSVSDSIALVRRYLIQETIGPLKQLGWVLLYGLASAICFSTGTILAVVGVLRLIQTETGTTFYGDWSWVPYVFAALFGLALGAGYVLFTLHDLGGLRRADFEKKEEQR